MWWLTGRDGSNIRFRYLKRETSGTERACSCMCVTKWVFEVFSTVVFCKGKIIFPRLTPSLCYPSTHDWSCHVFIQPLCFLFSGPILALPVLAKNFQAWSGRYSLPLVAKVTKKKIESKSSPHASLETEQELKRRRQLR